MGCGYGGGPGIVGGRNEVEQVVAVTTTTVVAIAAAAAAAVALLIVVIWFVRGAGKGSQTDERLADLVADMNTRMGSVSASVGVTPW